MSGAAFPAPYQFKADVLRVLLVGDLIGQALTLLSREAQLLSIVVIPL